jgi:hypothetical protein
MLIIQNHLQTIQTQHLPDVLMSEKEDDWCKPS